MSNIFDSFLSTPEATQAFDAESFIEAMLRFESALATAQAEAGLIPRAAAQTIAESCRLELLDVDLIVSESGRAGSVAIPFVKNLKDVVGHHNADTARFVHFGSTSQDVIDTAMSLLARHLLDLLDADLAVVCNALITLADKHANTPMLARTLMQPASVTSFGFKCACWVAPLVRSRQRLRLAGGKALRVQLGGAVGTLAQMKERGVKVQTLMAAELKLRAPEGAWHTQRDEWVALGCELGLLAGSLGKMAKDIALMGQFEVAEVAEPAEAGRGGSSAMPHKRNPVASMVAIAAAARAPHHVAALLSAMPQEHERALGNWQAELAEWPGLWSSVSGAARAMAQALPGLQVDSARMLVNINALRKVLPDDAADEWFDPALAHHAAGLTREQVLVMRGMHDQL